MSFVHEAVCHVNKCVVVCIDRVKIIKLPGPRVQTILVRTMSLEVSNLCVSAWVSGGTW
jgi:hypothetical protein